MTNVVCDECMCLLVDIEENGDYELYCPNCDCGPETQLDGLGEANECACGMKLATWFPFSKCPVCITGNPIPTPKKMAS
jgi:hypothetical protein